MTVTFIISVAAFIIGGAAFVISELRWSARVEKMLDAQRDAKPWGEVIELHPEAKHLHKSGR